MEQELNKSEKNKKMSKKVYRTPTIIKYGNVSKLTQAGGSTNGEAGNNMMV